MNERDEQAQKQDEEERHARCLELYVRIKWIGGLDRRELKDLRYFLGLNKEQP